jgi:uncharacterized protein with HEPN domain
MKKDEVVFLEHILESIMLIENYTADKSFTDFMTVKQPAKIGDYIKRDQ